MGSSVVDVKTSIMLVISSVDVRATGTVVVETSIVAVRPSVEDIKL